MTGTADYAVIVNGVQDGEDYDTKAALEQLMAGELNRVGLEYEGLIRSEEITDKILVNSKAAQVAQRELRMLIDNVEPEGEFGDWMSPLARAHKRIEEMDEETEADLEGLQTALEIIENVSEETGQPHGHYDPLQSDVFESKSKLEEALKEDDSALL